MKEILIEIATWLATWPIAMLAIEFAISLLLRIVKVIAWNRLDDDDPEKADICYGVISAITMIVIAIVNIGGTILALYLHTRIELSSQLLTLEGGTIFLLTCSLIAIVCTYNRFKD